jgi:hypothetical protein
MLTRVQTLTIVISNMDHKIGWENIQQGSSGTGDGEV